MARGLKRMPIFNFYLFNADFECVCYKEWRRENRGGLSLQDDFQLMIGMLHSLSRFAKDMSGKEADQVVRYYKTSVYKLNYLETATGLRFVLNTDPDAVAVDVLLREIYQLLVDTVLRNPLLDTSTKIESELFDSRLDALVRSHSSFS